MKLKLKDAKIISLSIYPGEEAITQVLVIAAMLTPPLAEKLGCREACYDDRGVPRKFEAYPTAGLSMMDCDITMGDWSGRATLVRKFKISQPKTGGDNDVTLQVQMRIHFGAGEFVSDFVKSWNKSEFEATIRGRQQELDFDGEEEQESEPEPVAAGTVASKREMVAK